MPERSFGELFSSAYDRVRQPELRKHIAATDALSSLALKAEAELGHPDFEHLGIGETKESQGVILFLDVRGFTKLSFALSNEELLRILLALTEAGVASVVQYGGHVIEFTGDGIMAAFGDAVTAPESAAFAALRTAAVLLKGVRDDVNPRLKQVDTEPIRTAIGMEFGEILWSRIGSLGTTQVKPISEATFLAGKLATGDLTKAWEAKVGADLAAWIPDDFKTPVPKYEFTLNKTYYSRDLYLFKWQQFGDAYQLHPDQVRKRLVERKLSSKISRSPYLPALRELTEAGYGAVFEDSAECPYICVPLDGNRKLDAIITFDSGAAKAVPKIYVRTGDVLEAVEIDSDQWSQSGADLPGAVAAVQRAWSR
jgi:class 3 adenylate cyclase